MKRRLLVWSFLAVVTLSLIGTLAWLSGTETGARWLLGWVSRSTTVSLTVDHLEGCLANDLKLKGIRIRHADRDIGIDQGTMSWRPWELVWGRISFGAVSVQGMSWREKKPDQEPPDLTWPKVPSWLVRLWGGVRVFQLENFVYYRPEAEPMALDRLRARLEWRFGTLTVSELDVQSPLGGLSGTMGAGFAEPALFGDLILKQSPRLGGMDQLAIVLTPAKAYGREQVAGDLKLTATAGKTVQLSAWGHLGVKKEGLIFRDFQVQDPSGPGKATLNGDLRLASAGVVAEVQFQVTGWRPDRESPETINLSGALSLQGNLKKYVGRFAVTQQHTSARWLSGTLRGELAGNGRGLNVREATGGILGGRVTGRLDWTWEGGHRLAWSLEGQGLNPAGFLPDWHGRIGVRTSGTLAWVKPAPLQGSFRIVLLDSVLRGKTLSGFLDARWEGGVLHLDRCTLRGRGFQGSAQGSLADRITYQVQVTDLSGMLPEASGRMSGDGWVRREKGEWAGVLKGRGASLSIGGLTMETMDVRARLNDPSRDDIAASVVLGKTAFGPFRMAAVKLDAAGKVSGHTVQMALTGTDGDARVSLTGQYAHQQWQAVTTTGWLRDRRTGTLQLSRPAAVSLSREHLRIAGLALTGGPEETLLVDSDISLRSPKGNLFFRWQKLNLARANALLETGKLSGETTGTLALAWADHRWVKLSGSHAGGFTWRQDDTAVIFERAVVHCDGSEKGLESSWKLALKESGRIEGTFSSFGPIGFPWPEAGRFQTVWQSIDVGLLKPWFGKNIQPTGRLSGQVQGTFRGKDRLEMDGQMEVSAGKISWQTAQGILATSVRQAKVTFAGKDKQLSGDLAVELTDYGQISGAFKLAVASYLPFRIDDDGPIRLQGKGRVQERGALSAVFPGMIKETRGEVQFDIGATGTWRRPDFKGKAVLEGAAAYFPRAGIRLDGARVEAHWIQDKISIPSFQMRSGGDELQGSATLWIKSGRIARYEGTLTGKHVPVVYLPEIRIWATPDLQFSGSGQGLILRGTIEIPEALLHFADTKGVVRPSEDVVIVDLPKKSRKSPAMTLDAAVTVLLGEKVRLRVEGLQGNLKGKVSLKASGWENIRGNGRIEMVKGFYEQYGVKLDIVRGQAVFKGEPVETGNLDLLALKTVRGSQGSADVQAGVIISGQLRSPIVKLYGRPAMSDQDVISYMVLGQPYRQDAGQSQKEQMAQWAGAILAGGPTSSFPRHLKERLGIDRVGVETSSSGGLNRSLVTVGKYLSPDLYIAFGRSLFGDDYYVSTRYSFLKNWQIETRVGQQSGADLYYRIEFD